MSYIDKEYLSTQFENYTKKAKEYIDSRATNETTKVSNFDFAYVKWTNNLLEGNNTIEQAASNLAKNAFIATQVLDLNSLAPISRATGNDYTEDSKKIYALAKQIRPTLRRFEYIQIESMRSDFTYEGEPARLNPDGSWEGSTAQLSGSTRIYTREQIKDWFKYFKSIGADGVFLDDFRWDDLQGICAQMGYNAADYPTLVEAQIQKYTDIFNDAHELGLDIIINGVLTSDLDPIYTLFTENDIIAFESSMCSSDSGSFARLGIEDLYVYNKEYYNKKTKAKSWSINYIPTDCDGCWYKKIVTMETTAALCTATHYLSTKPGAYNEKGEIAELLSELVSIDAIIRHKTCNYTLSLNDNILEFNGYDALGGSTLTEETLDQIICKYNNKRFENEYLVKSVLGYSIQEEIATIEGKINELSHDAKSPYWRVTIDDWATTGRKLPLYTNYLNWAWDFPSSTNTFTLTGDMNEFSATTTTEGWQTVRLFTMDFTSEQFSPLKGKTIEFGAKRLEWTNDVRPSMQIVTESGGTSYSLLTQDSLVTALDDNLTGFAYTYTIPSDCKSLTVAIWDGWYNTTPAGTVSGTSAYVIIPDEITPTKTWYTNILSTDMNSASAASLSATAAQDEKYGKMYNLTYTWTDPWGWCTHRYSSDEVVAMRGKTYEFGCDVLTKDNPNGEVDLNNGSLVIGVGINTYSSGMPNPRTYVLDAASFKLSKAFETQGEIKKYNIVFTVPENAIDLTIGAQSYGMTVPSHIIMQNVYLYDLNEEGIEIRGKGLSNTALQVSRVDSAHFTPFDSSVSKPNMLYFNDDGKMYMTNDLNEMRQLGMSTDKLAIGDGIAEGNGSAAIGTKQGRTVTYTIEDVEYSIDAPLAYGEGSQALGEGTFAYGRAAHAEGASNLAQGAVSHAEGSGNRATGICSHAEGASTQATGGYSHAEGVTTVSSGSYSHAEGSNTTASGTAAHAEGQGTKASGSFSHAEGNNTKAVGDYSHAEGTYSTANGAHSHAEGLNTIANKDFSHAEGNGAKANGQTSHAEGNMTEAIGEGSHTEGNMTIAQGSFSHAEGLSSHAYGHYSHVEGLNSYAYGQSSHVEGNNSVANGVSSHAEGINTKANGASSHAEGVSTIADGQDSHAEGSYTKAAGESSHAEGSNTIAKGNYQHVEGVYNTDEDKRNAAEWPAWDSTLAYEVGDKVSYNDNYYVCNTAVAAGGTFNSENWTLQPFESKYVHIVGNGTEEQRANAHTLDWGGNAWFAGTVTAKDKDGNEVILGGSKEAADIAYSNETSKLSSTNTQGAIDEIISNGASKIYYKDGVTISNQFTAIDGSFTSLGARIGEQGQNINNLEETLNNKSNIDHTHDRINTNKGVVTVNGEGNALYYKDGVLHMWAEGNKLHVGNSVTIWEDGEGGNIEIHAGNSHTNSWQIDSYNGDLRFYTYKESDGSFTAVMFRQDGTIVGPAESAYGLRSYRTDGSNYGTTYWIRSSYNMDGDMRFRLHVDNNSSDATRYGVRVDYADNATYAPYAKNGCNNIYSSAGTDQSVVSMVGYAEYIEIAARGTAYGINWWQSDTKLKKNIEPTIVTALDKIKQIEFVQFDWKNRDGHVDLGVSANQIEEIMPDAVYEVNQPEDSEYETLKNVNSSQMITYALKAIQELSAKIDSLEQEIERLKIT